MGATDKPDRRCLQGLSGLPVIGLNSAFQTRAGSKTRLSVAHALITLPRNPFFSILLMRGYRVGVAGSFLLPEMLEGVLKGGEGRDYFLHI